jgi:hypothetical protein
MNGSSDASLSPKRERGSPARRRQVNGPATRAARAAQNDAPRCRVGERDPSNLAPLRGAASLALRARRACLAIALVVTLLLASPAVAQDVGKKDDKKVVAFDGSEVFCYLLQRYNLAPLKTAADFAAADPADTLLVLFGDLAKADKLGVTSEMLGGFQRKGGNALVATDYADKGYLAPLKFFLFDVKVTQPVEARYRGMEQCPLLGPDQLPREHPLFLKAGKDQAVEPLAQGIATNAPGQLLPRPGFDLEPLASYLVVPRRQQATGAIYGSAAASPTQGRVVALAGHGAFMNGMMLQPDNDNFAFALNCVDWLGESTIKRRRTKALFVFEGEIVQSFEVNLSPPIPPIPMPTAKLINRLLRGLEDERFFHHLLLDGGMGSRIVQFMLALATFALILYAGKKLLETKHTLDTAVPLLVGPHAANPSDLPLAEQRAAALLTKNNLWEEARALSLDWWRRNAPAGLLERSPWLPLEFRGVGWLQRRKLHASATMVWQFARRQSPLPVPRKLFQQLLQALEDLDDALDRRQLHVIAGDGSEKS